MPRKRVLGPATAAQILDYFQTIDVATGAVVLELSTAAFKKRQPKVLVQPKLRKSAKAADKPSLAEA